MKRAVILHGTDASPADNWFPWLKGKLEAEDYEVWVPSLPNNHVPSWKSYNDFLLESDWNLSGNLVIGHSSGAVEVLNLLMDERCPAIDMGIMVSAWDHGVPLGMDASQFVDLFRPQGFDFGRIKSQANKLAFLHGADDPYCPLEQAEYLAASLEAPLTVVPHGHHLGSKFKELPELWHIIEPDLG